jgi:hypothetical protein
MSFNCEELEVEKSKKYKLLIGYAQAKCSTLEFKIFFDKTVHILITRGKRNLSALLLLQLTNPDQIKIIKDLKDFCPFLINNIIKKISIRVEQFLYFAKL